MAIYQLSQRQYDVLSRMANLDEPLPVYTVVSPISTDDESLRTELTKERDEAHDLVGLGLTRSDIEGLDKIALAVSAKVGRPAKVYTITSVGFRMFHGTTKRATN